MFDKIPSVKDFIIYAIPGLMICYCFVSIVNFAPTDHLPTMQDLSQNAGLALVSVLFAFIIGFISSQIQIIILNKIINWRNPGIRTLSSSNLSEDIKNKIAVEVIKLFNLEIGTDLSIIKTDKNTVNIVINYLILNVNSEAVKFFERDANMSSFAISLPLPISLFCYLISLKLQLHGFLLILIPVFITLIITFFCLQVSVNFRRGWVEKIFYQFLIITKVKESSKIKQLQHGN